MPLKGLKTQVSLILACEWLQELLCPGRQNQKWILRDLSLWRGAGKDSAHSNLVMAAVLAKLPQLHPRGENGWHKRACHCPPGVQIQ